MSLSSRIGRRGARATPRGARALFVKESKEPAVQQDGLAADLVEHAARGVLDLAAMQVERREQIVLFQRRRAEMILERLGRDRALHVLAIDERRKCDDEIARAILGRRILRKRNLHDGHDTLL
ncbi:hypothetical protein DM45_3330 [Burkholderia mallei]|nr:hypothetical protein DM45_3330 [Burkholderia mallei]KOT11330.1 hypothetical protein DM77_2826 [Burkholderia mallei]